MSLIIIFVVLALITYIIAEVMLLSKGKNFVKSMFNIDSLFEFIMMNFVFIILISLTYLILGAITAYLVAIGMFLRAIIWPLIIWIVLYTLYYLKKQLYGIYVKNKDVIVKKKKSKK